MDLVKIGWILTDDDSTTAGPNHQFQLAKESESPRSSTMQKPTFIKRITIKDRRFPPRATLGGMMSTRLSFCRELVRLVAKELLSAVRIGKACCRLWLLETQTRIWVS